MVGMEMEKDLGKVKGLGLEKGKDLGRGKGLEWE